jgi:hypothetical protein
VRDLTSDNFGILIAYLLPGFVALWAARPLVPAIDAWLAVTPDRAPTVGGFLYVTLGSVAAGMLVSIIRWALLDTLHHRTGLSQPAWDFTRFPATMAAFDSLVQDHYRYYQHYGNMLVAIALVYASSGLGGRPPSLRAGWIDVGVLAIGLILFLGSRDALRKYYERTMAVFDSQAGTSPSIRDPSHSQRSRPVTRRRPRRLFAPARHSLRIFPPTEQGHVFVPGPVESRTAPMHKA